MTALVTTPESTIQQIQSLLSEGYGSGFTIFKELVQNADDVGASRMLLAGHDGFAEADNILLRAPGIFVANDGPVSAANWRGLKLAAGGSKGGDGEAVGRFGLGQKALYHLCDAYCVLARIDGAAGASSMVLNPYEEIAEAQNAAGWKDLSASDTARLADWALHHGMDKGLALYIPLRTADLRPSSNPRISLTNSEWTPQSALSDIRNGAQLYAALACLRCLQQIEIQCPGQPTWRAEMEPGFTRLAGPGAAAGSKLDRDFGGAYLVNGRTAHVHGVQHCAHGGRAHALQDRPDWPMAWTLEGSGKAKATPHGAAIVCRHPEAPGKPAFLRIWQGVYLPLGDPARDRKALLHEAVLTGGESVDIIVHGDFFVSSDRSTLLSAGANKGQDAAMVLWNEALMAEAALPCVLDALRETILAMPNNQAGSDLVTVLRRSEWWAENAPGICKGRALIRPLKSKTSEWEIVPVGSVRPMPISDAVRSRQLTGAWPGFDDWCQTHDFVLAQGASLCAGQPEWTDQELVEIVEGFGPAAMSGKGAADTLCSILDYVARGSGRIPPLAARALANVFAQAMRDIGRLAPITYLKKLTAHLPDDLPIVLPSQVTEPSLLAELAALPDVLCLRSDWMQSGADSRDRPITMDEAVAMLEVLEPMLQRHGAIQSQAMATVAHILVHGPKFIEYSHNPRTQSLAIVPVMEVAGRTEAMLTPSRVISLLNEGLLFHHGPAKALPILAEAIVEPRIYQLRQGIALVPPAAKPLASSNKASDRVAVVGKVLRFGSVAARSRLLADLRDDLTSGLLRRVIAGETGLRDDVELARVPSAYARLAGLVRRIASDDRSLYLIDPEIADQMTANEVQKAHVTDLDLRWIERQISTKRSRMEPLDEDEAEALLASGITLDALRPLALHRVLGAEGLHSSAALLRGRPEQVPASMRGLVKIVDPWPDSRAGARQRELIEDWSSERQIALALAQKEPHRFCADILDALDDGGMSASIVAALLETPWLMVGGQCHAPSDVLDITPEAALAWADIVQAPVPVLRSDLPGRVNDLLTRHNALADAATSYHTMLIKLARASATGLVVNPAEHGDDLAALARAGCDLDEPIWPVIAGAVAALEPGRLQATFAGINLGKPDEASAIDQLNALARIAGHHGQAGEAALRIWRAAFVQFSPELRNGTGFYPADLLVESASGAFSRADALALSASGIASQDLLRPDLRFDLPDDHTTTALKGPDAAQPITEIVDELFTPFEPFPELHTPVTMVLAMMGRGPAITNCARRFRANPGFNDICAMIETMADGLYGLYGPLASHMQQLRLQVVAVGDGKALVLSAAGSTMLAATGGDAALLYDCNRIGGGTTSWQLTYSVVKPRDLKHATELLRGAAKVLMGMIGMRMNNQRGAVLRQFDSYLESDEATLDELIVDIRDGLAERIKKLTRGTFLKAALTRYDEDLKKGRFGHNAEDARLAAKTNLWKAVSSPDAASELLSSIRVKMIRRNYAPSRTLFELFQNAVDAAHQNGMPSDVRVEAIRNADGDLCHLRFIHWGRGINIQGGPKTPVRYERDLDNMLDFDSSEKDGDHGKHGLGFKTTHMLSDDVRVASGRLRFRIKGGMIPEAWEDGRALQQKYDSHAAQATIIDIPIADGVERAAEDAWNSFASVAAFLPVVTDDIEKIELVDGLSTRVEQARPCQLAENIGLVEYGQDQRALKLAVGPKADLFIKLVDGMPVPFAANWPRLWNLAPLDGEGVETAWLINAPFEMDQGRRGLHGQSSDKDSVFHAMGGPLGERLIALFENWDEIALAAGLDVSGRSAFFDALFARLARDAEESIVRGLHVSGNRPGGGYLHGLAALAETHPVIPLVSGGMVRAGEADAVFSHSLADSEMRQKVLAWGGDAVACRATDASWDDRLASLGFGRRRAVDLGSLAESLFAGKAIGPDQARRYASVYNSSDHAFFHPDEKRRVDAALKGIEMQSEIGDFVAVNRLWFPQDTRDNVEGRTERMRAAFMPSEARLHPGYQGDALEFAQLARSYNSSLELQYLNSASRDPDRQFGALVFLAANPSEIGKASWLTSLEALTSLSAYKRLTRQQRGILEAWFCSDDDDIDVHDGLSLEYQVQREASEILTDIAEWWSARRDELTAHHEEQTFGTLCSPGDLRDGDDVAWFTLLSLGSFQTIGRITPQQSRHFIERCVQQGWWSDLAHVDEYDRELRHYADRLLAWTDIGAADDYMMWRRCLGDMCMIARHLETYREIFMRLPQMIEQEGDNLALSDLLRPASSHIVSRMGMDGGPIARSLGMGANWIVRELARRGVYETGEAHTVQPFAWSGRLRIRNFIREIGLGDFASGIDAGRMIHDSVCDEIGLRTPFGIHGDLPLELFNTRQFGGKGWLSERGEILSGNWCPQILERVA